MGRLQEFEEIATFLPQVEESVGDVSKFSQVVNLIGFFPFKTAGDALANINSVSEGIVHDDLKLFLDTNMPKKGKGCVLGVSDSKLSAGINDACNIKCSHIGVIPEVIRGIRQHFPKLVKGFSAVTSDKAQLGLSHSYSRAKVKFNVNKSDNMIIQSIALLDQLDKDVNTFAMRIREWCSYHFPELIKIVPENALYARVVKLIKNRKELSQDLFEKLEEILMDSSRAQAVIDASKSSLGMDISPIDLLNIDTFASRVIGLTDYRKELPAYLQSKMGQVAPNLATLIRDVVGARLISHAGSLTNLAKAPASTVQILGAEKALFRALKTRGNTPKYGLIFHSSFIGRAGAKNKGRISRYLANKCSIASRIDALSEDITTVFGSKLKEQVEERLKFYETGDLPRKNVDVMNEAVEEAAAEMKNKKKKKDKKKRAADADTAAGDTTVEDDTEEPPKKKKKKKNKEAAAEAAAETTVNTTADVEEETPKKKKKNKKNKQEEVEVAAAETTVNTTTEAESPKKKKKKSKLAEDEVEVNGDVSLEEVVPALSEKKKKKKKNK